MRNGGLGTLEPILITWRELLIVAVVVLGLYVVELLVLLRRGNRKGLLLWRRGVAAHDEHYAVTALRLELSALRQQVGELRAEVERLSTGAPQDQAPTAYGQAIQLARQGRAPAQIAVTTGISRGEAELIAALYRGH
jgi:hypothetical protein